ncbi:MAG: protein-L-isoaspartate O-methyltransferase [Candidatus Woesearchaeota archaeon]
MNNDDLVELVRTKEFYLKHKSPRDEKVLEAMRKVDRRDFLTDGSTVLGAFDPDLMGEMDEFARNFFSGTKDGETESRKNAGSLLMTIANLFSTRRDYETNIKDLAYNDFPLPLGETGQTCSQPSMVGFMSDVLELEKGMKVLEVGSGCGYHAAVISYLVGEEGKVVTIEYVPALAELAEKNLKAHFGDKGFEKRFKVICGDGSVGFKEEAPFDRIYLTAGVELKEGKFNPYILTKQLNPDGGILLYPEKVGDMIKHKFIAGKIIDKERFSNVTFVPLQGENS